MNEMPTLLLVHGSWHGAWCWGPLVVELARLGVASVAPDLPSCGLDPGRLGTLVDDARAVEAAAAAIGGPVLAVGHSYAGAVLSEARLPANVVGQILISAFMPDTGRTYPSYLPPGPLPPFVQMRSDGSFGVTPGTAVDTFYNACPVSVARWAEARIGLQNQSVLGHAVADASWRRLATTYVMLARDHALPMPAQQMFAAQARDSITFDSDHSPFLSRPAEFAALLHGLAAPRADGGRRLAS